MEKRETERFKTLIKSRYNNAFTRKRSRKSIRNHVLLQKNRSEQCAAIFLHPKVFPHNFP